MKLLIVALFSFTTSYTQASSLKSYMCLRRYLNVEFIGNSDGNSSFMEVIRITLSDNKDIPDTLQTYRLNKRISARDYHNLRLHSFENVSKILIPYLPTIEFQQNENWAEVPQAILLSGPQDAAPFFYGREDYLRKAPGPFRMKLNFLFKEKKLRFYIKGFAENGSVRADYLYDGSDRFICFPENQSHSNNELVKPIDYKAIEHKKKLKDLI